MGNNTAVAHEDHARNLACCDGLITAIINITALIVTPFAFGEIAHSRLSAFEQWSHENLCAKHISVLHKPCAWVVGELDEQGAHHWQATLRAVLGLCIYVRHEFVF